MRLLPKPSEITNVLDEYASVKRSRKTRCRGSVYKRIETRLGREDVELQKSNIC